MRLFLFSLILSLGLTSFGQEINSSQLPVHAEHEVTVVLTDSLSQQWIQNKLNRTIAGCNVVFGTDSLFNLQYSNPDQYFLVLQSQRFAGDCYNYFLTLLNGSPSAGIQNCDSNGFYKLDPKLPFVSRILVNPELITKPAVLELYINAIDKLAKEYATTPMSDMKVKLSSSYKTTNWTNAYFLDTSIDSVLNVPKKVHTLFAPMKLITREDIDNGFLKSLSKSEFFADILPYYSANSKTPQWTRYFLNYSQGVIYYEKSAPSPVSNNAAIPVFTREMLKGYKLNQSKASNK